MAAAGNQQRRLLQDMTDLGSTYDVASPPQILDSHTVAVSVPSLGGFYYLVGGQAPLHPSGLSKRQALHGLADSI